MLVQGEEIRAVFWCSKVAPQMTAVIVTNTRIMGVNRYTQSVVQTVSGDDIGGYSVG